MSRTSFEWLYIVKRWFDDNLFDPVDWDYPSNQYLINNNQNNGQQLRHAPNNVQSINDTAANNLNLRIITFNTW
jgi:hypothetical protein